MATGKIDLTKFEELVERLEMLSIGRGYSGAFTTHYLTDAMPLASSRHPLSEKFHDLLNEAGELHDSKQADYGVDTDPFINVRQSTDWNVTPWVGAMMRANDKIKRLQSFVKKGSLKNESARDSLMDIAVYSLIAIVLMEEDNDSV